MSTRWRVAFALCGALTLTAGCEREQRRYREIPAASARPDQTELTTLQPGPTAPEPPAFSPYQVNAYGIGEGKRLYGSFNCSGCHATAGGGAIGPALTDDLWVYGGSPEQIYSTISQGRPNGMPAFGKKVPVQQIWQLVAYVQSLGGNVPKDAAPGRNDDMAVGKPEQRKPREQPKLTGHR